MFKYVPSATFKPLNSICKNCLNQVKQALKKEYGIDSDIFLIGSGRKNLVTQNGNLPFDLDYNIQISNYQIKQLPISDDELKDFIIKVLNKSLKKCDKPFKDCQDSTSAITARLVYNDKLQFSFDVALLARNKNGDLCRLLHDKTKNCYLWAQIFDSSDVFDRAEGIKSNGLWEELRATYLDKKNRYLQQNSKCHPSFNVFVEAVNEVFYANFEED